MKGTHYLVRRSQARWTYEWPWQLGWRPGWLFSRWQGRLPNLQGKPVDHHGFRLLGLRHDSWIVFEPHPS